MRIDREHAGSQRGPAEWFTGEVWLDELAPNTDAWRTKTLSVHFAPGARTAWHHHPLGQVLHITEGEGRAQSRGGPVEVLRAGDVVHFEPGEEHWHGASPKRFMTHLALQPADDAGDSIFWGDHVTDDEYLSPPST